MIVYTTVGTTDMVRAKAFYDALFAEMGAKMMMDMGRLAAYGTGEGAMFAVCIPFDESTPNPGNGNMVSIGAGSKEMVDKLHAKALELGATDDGAPGARSDVFYGAYFRDLDGNKVCFCHFG
jgi:predicted lactoylglutathione lyase